METFCWVLTCHFHSRWFWGDTTAKVWEQAPKRKAIPVHINTKWNLLATMTSGMLSCIYTLRHCLHPQTAQQQRWTSGFGLCRWIFEIYKQNLLFCATSTVSAKTQRLQNKIKCSCSMFSVTCTRWMCHCIVNCPPQVWHACYTPVCVEAVFTLVF